MEDVGRRRPPNHGTAFWGNGYDFMANRSIPTFQPSPRLSPFRIISIPIHVYSRAVFFAAPQDRTFRYAVRCPPCGGLVRGEKRKEKGEMKLSSFYRKYSESFGKSVSFKTLSLTSMVTVYRAFVLIS